MKAKLCRAGFSLLEMIVVVSIILMITAFATPAVSSYINGQRLSTTSAALAAEFGEAHQLAQTLNRNVELRFYRYPDPLTPSSSDSYRARQLLIYNAQGAIEPRGPVNAFDTGIILASNKTFTTLLKNGESAPAAGDLLLPRAGTAYHYFGVVFQPDGSMRLSKGNSDRWCITVVNENQYRQAEVLPANFVTIQLDPHNSSVHVLQP